MEFTRTKTLKYDDLISINELLKTGLSLKQVLDLIKNKDNDNIIDSIILELDKGKQIEEVIIKYLPKNIGLYLNSLIENMSFNDSLNLALAFIDKNKENIKTFTSSFLYPFVLLFLSLSALYIFDAYGLDTILNMLNSFVGDFYIHKSRQLSIVYHHYLCKILLLLDL